MSMSSNKKRATERLRTTRLKEREGTETKKEKKKTGTLQKLKS
jgi:hypothetical protein